MNFKYYDCYIFEVWIKEDVNFFYEEYIYFSFKIYVIFD